MRLPLAIPCLSLLCLLCACEASSGAGEGAAAAPADTAALARGSDASSGPGEARGGSEPETATAGPEFVCDDGTGYDGAFLVPGRCEPGFDAELAAKARRHDRVFHAISAAAMGGTTDVEIGLDEEPRALIEGFAHEHDGWDFEAWSGVSAKSVVGSVAKATGMYAGAGIMADAYRYGILKAQGYPEAEVVQAREHLLGDLELLHTVVAITGVPGVVARSIAHKDWPGHGSVQTLPLFDEDGAPLPEVKNNGAWRADNSGLFPELVWEDSCSRDMLSGWAMGYQAVWEVIEEDDAFGATLKERMQADARSLGFALMEVAPSGYDLEVPDADGRRTLHGCLHENNFDCLFYMDDAYNGFNAILALGVVGAWATVSGDEELAAWLHDELIAERRLHEHVRDSMIAYSYEQTNYSAINMVYIGAWLACRTLDDPEVREVLAEGLHTSAYAIPGEPYPPIEQKTPFFDFAYAACLSGQSAAGPPGVPVDDEAVDRGLETLAEFSDAPYWNHGVIHCPEATCSKEDPFLTEEQKVCTALDGAKLELLGCVGWKQDLVATTPIPMAVRGPSNYHWRSNPYEPNRPGDGAYLLPAVDFRGAYWMGRWARRDQESLRR